MTLTSWKINAKKKPEKNEHVHTNWKVHIQFHEIKIISLLDKRKIISPKEIIGPERPKHNA